VLAASFTCSAVLKKHAYSLIGHILIGSNIGKNFKAEMHNYKLSYIPKLYIWKLIILKIGDPTDS